MEESNPHYNCDAPEREAEPINDTTRYEPAYLAPPTTPRARPAPPTQQDHEAPPTDNNSTTPQNQQIFPRTPRAPRKNKPLELWQRAFLEHIIGPPYSLQGHALSVVAHALQLDRLRVRQYLRSRRITARRRLLRRTRLGLCELVWGHTPTGL